VADRSGIAGSVRLLLGALAYQPGWQEPVNIATPPAGQAFTYTVDGRFHERLLSVTFRLVTSIVVANRFCSMLLTDNNNRRVTQGIASGAVAASTTLQTSLHVSIPVQANGAAGGNFGYLPDLLIPPGWIWSLNISAMDVADQVDQVMLLVQRFPSDITRLPAAQ
jgi:hypothetical protein